MEQIGLAPVVRPLLFHAAWSDAGLITLTIAGRNRSLGGLTSRNRRTS
jgi:hypothetical protein